MTPLNSTEAYVRAVEAAPEPMCILASKQQLIDLERFCTKEKFSVLSADPTFNLGPFYVTPLTCQNLLAVNKHGTHPSLLGPILVHQTKTFHAFYFCINTY